MFFLQYQKAGKVKILGSSDVGHVAVMADMMGHAMFVVESEYW